MGKIVRRTRREKVPYPKRPPPRLRPIDEKVPSRPIPDPDSNLSTTKSGGGGGEFLESVGIGSPTTLSNTHGTRDTNGITNRAMTNSNLAGNSPCPPSNAQSQQQHLNKPHAAPATFPASPSPQQLKRSPFIKSEPPEENIRRSPFPRANTPVFRRPVFPCPKLPSASSSTQRQGKLIPAHSNGNNNGPRPQRPPPGTPTPIPLDLSLVKTEPVSSPRSTTSSPVPPVASSSSPVPPVASSSSPVPPVASSSSPVPPVASSSSSTTRSCQVSPPVPNPPVSALVSTPKIIKIEKPEGIGNHPPPPPPHTPMFPTPRAATPKPLLNGNRGMSSTTPVVEHNNATTKSSSSVNVSSGQTTFTRSSPRPPHPPPPSVPKSPARISTILNILRKRHSKKLGGEGEGQKEELQASIPVSMVKQEGEPQWGTSTSSALLPPHRESKQGLPTLPPEHGPPPVPPHCHTAPPPDAHICKYARATTPLKMCEVAGQIRLSSINQPTHLQASTSSSPAPPQYISINKTTPSPRPPHIPIQKQTIISPLVNIPTQKKASTTTPQNIPVSNNANTSPPQNNPFKKPIIPPPQSNPFKKPIIPPPRTNRVKKPIIAPPQNIPVNNANTSPVQNMSMPMKEALFAPPQNIPIKKTIITPPQNIPTKKPILPPPQSNPFKKPIIPPPQTNRVEKPIIAPPQNIPVNNANTSPLQNMTIKKPIIPPPPQNNPVKKPITYPPPTTYHPAPSGPPHPPRSVPSIPSQSSRSRPPLQSQVSSYKGLACNRVADGYSVRLVTRLEENYNDHRDSLFTSDSKLMTPLKFIRLLATHSGQLLHYERFTFLSEGVGNGNGWVQWRAEIYLGQFCGVAHACSQGLAENLAAAHCLDRMRTYFAFSDSEWSPASYALFPGSVYSQVWWKLEQLCKENNFGSVRFETVDLRGNSKLQASLKTKAAWMITYLAKGLRSQVISDDPVFGRYLAAKKMYERLAKPPIIAPTEVELMDEFAVGAECPKLKEIHAVMQLNQTSPAKLKWAKEMNVRDVMHICLCLHEPESRSNYFRLVANTPGYLDRIQRVRANIAKALKKIIADTEALCKKRNVVVPLSRPLRKRNNGSGDDEMVVDGDGDDDDEINDNMMRIDEESDDDIFHDALQF